MFITFITEGGGITCSSARRFILKSESMIFNEYFMLKKDNELQYFIFSAVFCKEAQIISLSIPFIITFSESIQKYESSQMNKSVNVLFLN